MGVSSCNFIAAELVRSNLLYAVFVGVFALGFVSPASAAQSTFLFEGFYFDSPLPNMSGAPDFSNGDTFTGSFTVDDSTAAVPHPDSTLNLQYPGALVSWSLSFVSQGYAFTGGIGGNISVGNDTSFGDRYTINFTNAISVGTPLPSGRTFEWFQLDFQDSYASGADFLSDDSLPVSVDLNLIQSSVGRMLLTDGATLYQLPISTTNLTTVPVPGAIWLVGSGVIGLVGYRRRASAAS